MANFTNDWFTSRIPGWSEILAELQGQPIHALEIGCYEGMATLWLLENILTHPSSNITVIDTFEGSKEHQQGKYKTSFKFTEQLFKENIQPYAKKVRIVKGKSQEKLLTLRDSFEFIYIDGSHETRDVLTDGIVSWQLLSHNGIMIFDDYDNDEVAMAVDIFLHLWNGEYLQVGHGGQMAIKKL